MRTRSIFATILVVALSAPAHRRCDAFTSTLPWTRLNPSGSPYEPIQRSPRDGRYSSHSSSIDTANSEELQDRSPSSTDWLERTTTALLETEPGSLVKGKWHQLLSMMAAWSRRVDDRNAPLVCERLLKRALDEHLAGNAECFPTTEFYNHVIDAWAAWTNTTDNNKASSSLEYDNSTARAASRRARQILHWLQRTYDVEQDPARRPNARSFYSVFMAIIKTEKPPVALGMLKWREHLYTSGQNPDAKPSLFAYVTVLDAFASSGMEDAGEQAEGVLKQMTDAGVEPTTLCYNIAIKAWIKSGRGRQAAEYAERILEEMKAPPDVITYSSMIHAWATSGMKEHAAERAEEILQRLENDETAEGKNFVVAYNACLNAWCKSQSPMAVNRTEALLSRMEASEHVAPDLVSYNTYLHALAMAGKDTKMAQRADATLCRWEEQFDNGEIDFSPSVFSYNLVIEGWTRSGDPHASTRASDVLRKLVKRDGVEPDRISFNQVINALSRSPLPDSARKAEDLLHYMDESYENGVYDFKADVVGYTSAITAWSRSGQTGNAERAERLLVEMETRYVQGEEDLKPTTHVYNAVIDAHAKSGEGTLGARRAEALLQRMQDRGIPPDIITYNAVLNSWARSGTRCCAYKAERYLNKMWELYEAGNKRVKPDGNSYNTLINAISKSKNDDKAQKALRILRRMDKLYRAGDKDTRPDELTYTAVLNSCAFPAVLDPKSRKKALDTAIFTLAELQGSPYGKPNHLTYGTFLKACANLMPRDDELRRMVVEPVFQQCCEDGQVGGMVLTHLRNAAPKDLYRELLKDVVSSGTKIRVQDLPREWRRNVQEQRRWPRRARAAVRQGKPQAVRQKRRLAP